MPPNGFSVTHYVGIAGVGSDAASWPMDGDAIGFFGYDRTLHEKDFKGGLANTLMVIQTGLDNGPWVASGYPTVQGYEPERVPYFGIGGQFGGLHRGGANALFADGSVRFLSDDIDRGVLEAMCKIAK